MPENEFDKSKMGLSIISLILGIISLILTFTGIGIITGIIGILLGGISLHKQQGSKGMAIAGIVLNSLSIICLVLVICVMTIPWYLLAH